MSIFIDMNCSSSNNIINFLHDVSFSLFLDQEEKLKDKPGYEHLNEPLHLLVEAEFPEDIIESRLDHAVALLENLLKPVVW